MADTRTFKFVAAPPERSMRKKSPGSAPRLFEWLVEQGYVEPVSTNRSNAAGWRGAGETGGGRVGAGKKKKRKSPF